MGNFILLRSELNTPINPLMPGGDLLWTPGIKGLSRVFFQIKIYRFTLCKGTYSTWRRSDVFIVNFEHILHLFLVFLLFTLNK